MPDAIRELLADLPLANMTERPVGMLAIRRADVPQAERPAVDAWVGSAGGRIARQPLFKVHGGTSPDGPGGEEFYILPPSAFHT